MNDEKHDEHLETIYGTDRGSGASAQDGDTGREEPIEDENDPIYQEQPDSDEEFGS